MIQIGIRFTHKIKSVENSKIYYEKCLDPFGSEPTFSMKSNN